MKNDLSKKILIVAAHPDDEILGCGGTVARLIKEGCIGYTLILGEGVTSRDANRERGKRIQGIEKLKKQAHKANSIIGVKDVFVYDFPDNRFDEVALLDIVKAVEAVKYKVKPDVVYTHYWGDLNIDHRITCEAVLTACRPVKEEIVREIYSFEVPSSTEWNYPSAFNPNMFVDITGTFETKIMALQCYDAELRDFPHPRSEEALRARARQRGSSVGRCYAEAFKLVRTIK